MTNNLWVTLVLCVWACQLLRTYAGETGHMITDNSDMPNVKPTATKGMIIDGGSGGSRLHIYTWKPRVFHTVPPPLSYPESNEQWNGRIDPGIHTYANNYAGIKNHLAQLIDFAKMSLVGFEKEFGDYPIYFKATGGMRELDAHTRESMVAYIRVLLSDKSFCPFFFRDDFARVISGEEEAIFSWAATNFLMGTLISNSQGMGTVENVNTTYGTLDLGGASTQIAFYVPSQDILEGLTKFQIGGQKQWNVYTRSFLQFGINSARERHIRQLVDKFIAAQGMSANPTTRYTVVNDCFHTGYSEEAWDSTGQHAVDVVGPPNPSVNQLQNCRRLLEPLMERELDSFCNKVFHGDCSLVGAYQPPVPVGRHGHFIGTSSYKYPWSFLLLPKTATLEQMATQATKICSKNFGEINYYYVSNGLNANNDKLGDYLPYYCFLSAYVLTLLEDGYKFNQTQTLTVMDEVNGHKVGWALGAILYEINELPWVLQLSVVERHPLGFVFFAGVVGFFLGVAAAVVVYREITMDDPHRYNKPNDAQHTIININTSSGGSERSSKQPSRTPSRDENGFVGLQRTNTMEMIRYHSFQGGPETTPQPSKAKGSNNGNAGKSGDKGLALQPLSRANSNVSSTMSTPVYNNAPHSTSGTKLGSSFQSQGMLPPNGSANSRAGSTNPSRQNSFLATKSSGGAPPAGGTGSQNAFYIGSLSESGSGSDRKGGPSSNSNWGAPWVSPAAADEATPFFRHDGPASSSNMIDPHVLAAHKTRGPTSVAIPQMKRSASSGSSSSSSDGDDARHRHHRPHHASKPFPSSMSRGESGGDTTGRAGTVYGRIPSDGY